GLVLGGMLRPLLPTPVLALSASAAIAPMAYGVVTKQLLNPLRELNDDLRQQVQERSRELTETTRQLEDAHAALEDRGAQLRTAAQIAREAAAIHDVQRLLDETVHLISDRFHFYHAGIFLLDKGHEWAILRAASSDGGQRMLVRGHQLRSDQEGIVGYVTGRGEPRIALDVGADAVFFDNPDLPETRSEMALPLEARGEIIGALDVQSREPGAFTNEDVEVLQTLADQVAIAISNAHLFEQAQEALEAERQAYGEFSRRAWQRLQAAGQPSRSCFDPHGVLSGSEEWRDDMRQAAREGRPIRGYKLPDAVGGKGASETLAVPIKVRGNVIGALDARKSADGESRSDPWTPDEIALMQSLCQQLGAALESARLHQDVQRQAARERLVSDVASQMRESLDLTTVLRSGAEGIREAMDLRAVTVRLRDGGGRKEAENS
ncbi:MAG: GAF domain-containing protein, partial [Anaerolineae bacterium]